MYSLSFLILSSWSRVSPILRSSILASQGITYTYLFLRYIFLLLPLSFFFFNNCIAAVIKTISSLSDSILKKENLIRFIWYWRTTSNKSDTEMSQINRIWLIWQCIARFNDFVKFTRKYCVPGLRLYSKEAPTQIFPENFVKSIRKHLYRIHLADCFFQCTKYPYYEAF